MRDESTGLEPFVGLIISPFDPSVASSRSVLKYFHCRIYEDNKANQAVYIPFRIRTALRFYNLNSAPSSRFLDHPMLQEDFRSRLISKKYASLEAINTAPRKKDAVRVPSPEPSLVNNESTHDGDFLDLNNNIPVVDLSRSPGAAEAITKEGQLMPKRQRKQTIAVLQAQEQKLFKTKKPNLVVQRSNLPEEERASLLSYLAGSLAYEELSRHLICSSSPALRCCCLTVVTSGI